MITPTRKNRFCGALTLLVAAAMLATVTTASRRRLPDIVQMRQDYFGDGWNEDEASQSSAAPVPEHDITAGFMACKEWQKDQLERRHKAELGPVTCPDCDDDSPEECGRCNFSGQIIVNPEEYPVFPTMDHVRQIAEYRANGNQTYKDMICDKCRDARGRKSKVSSNKIAEAMQSVEQQLPDDIAQMVAGYLPCFACDGSGVECTDIKEFLKDPVGFKARLENDLREACQLAWHHGPYRQSQPWPRVELSADTPSDLGTADRIHREQVSSETANRMFGERQHIIMRRWNRVAIRERRSYVTGILQERQRNVLEKRHMLNAFLDYENPGLPLFEIE